MMKMKRVANEELTKQEHNKLIICGVLLVIGLFVAGIICSVTSLVLSLQIKKRNNIKMITIVLSVFEIVLSVISIINVWQQLGII